MLVVRVLERGEIFGLHREVARLSHAGHAEVDAAVGGGSDAEVVELVCAVFEICDGGRQEQLGIGPGGRAQQSLCESERVGGVRRGAGRGIRRDAERHRKGRPRLRRAFRGKEIPDAEGGGSGRGAVFDEAVAEFVIRVAEPAHERARLVGDIGAVVGGAGIAEQQRVVLLQRREGLDAEESVFILLLLELHELARNARAGCAVIAARDALQVLLQEDDGGVQPQIREVHDEQERGEAGGRDPVPAVRGEPAEDEGTHGEDAQEGGVVSLFPGREVRDIASEDVGGDGREHEA